MAEILPDKTRPGFQTKDIGIMGNYIYLRPIIYLELPLFFKKALWFLSKKFTVNKTMYILVLFEKS